MTTVLADRWPAASRVAFVGLLALHSATRPPIEPRSYAALAWRNIGPFRGGRISAVTGVIGHAGVFYAGLPAGGVLKTTSAGQTWVPVFDGIKEVVSVGAIEVAPSDPSIVYVGTGDMVTGGAINEGNGVYKSTDAGRTWKHAGLATTKQIPSILVDPRDPSLVLVAAQGPFRRKSDARGIFRSTDGGTTWTRTLYVDDETGVQKLARAYDEPHIIFATTVRHFAAPGTPARRGPESASTPTRTLLYKSTDDGLTWRPIAGNGLPRLVGRTSVAVAMTTRAQRVFLIGNFGLYRSDDGGTSWRRMAESDQRIANGQGGYNCGVYVDPQNPDIVYTINTSSYKSTDGGATFTGFKGAPGGDDPQQLWIDPTDGQRMLMGVDQGAIVTLDGGATWSSWYNQSTEQVYHIAADNSFPYWVYATQQDAGAIRTRSRGNLGEITPLDWSPVPGWEWGTIVPDPLDPTTLFASGYGIVKITYPAEQWINVSPALDPSLKLRTTSSEPLVWAPWNPRELLAGSQYVMATTDGGVHWKKISPDLALAPPVAPLDSGPRDLEKGSAGPPPPRGAIQTMSASTLAAGTIWVGTNTGFVHVTRDHGRTWSNVSVPGIANVTFADISTVEASHHDAATAYVAIDAHTTGDYAPHLYRTHDYGRSWTRIVTGLPTDEPGGSFARVIRADTKRAGLLFAGTETAMYVSFDDGDHWQSLMLNLPTTSYRDIVIRGNDLIVGTYGRGIWILDDYSVLRQLTAPIEREPVHLFKPGDAVRVRRNVNYNTPFPPEVPYALNPPDGVIVYYSLAAKPAGEISLDVLDASGAVVRHLSSAAVPPVAEAARPPEPGFWLAPPTPMSTHVGLNRVVWDVRHDPPPALKHTFEINANPGLTPPSPEGALALPGMYTLKLTVQGTPLTQKVSVVNDPRSRASLRALRGQHALLMALDSGIRAAAEGHRQAKGLRLALQQSAGASPLADAAAPLAAFTAKLDSLAGDADAEYPALGRGPKPPLSFAVVSDAFVRQLNAQDNADMAPTGAMLAAYATVCRDLETVAATWKRLGTEQLAPINAALTRQGRAAVAVPPTTSMTPRC